MIRITSFSIIALLIAIALSCSTESTPAYTLTTTASPIEGGTITPDAGTFEEGEAISLQAIPAEGWVFVRWEQDLSSTANPMNVTMNRDYNVVGVFEQRMHALTVNVEGEGTVTETVVQSKSTDYAEGTVVKLEAVPKENWGFSHWKGDLSGSDNPAEITVDEPKNIMAVFVTFPTVSTNSVESISDHSAQSGGEVTDDGGSYVTVRGVCWGTSQNPTTSDDCTSDGSGTGSFTSSITGLNQDTEYFVRAYAENIVGAGFGDQLEFHTYSDSQLTDIDGNIYETVVIGDQEWMAENLRVTRFQDGLELSTGLDLDQWVQTNNGAYAVYPHTNEEVNNIQTVDEMVDSYGYLYNWYTIDSNREICPTGWKIPSDDDWKTLETYLGMPEHEVDEYWTTEDHVRRGLNENVGGKLKTTGNTYWQSPNEGATNITGFSALPAGTLSVLPDDQGPSFLWYSGHGEFTYYWSSTKFNHENAPGGKVMWSRGLTFESGEIIRSDIIIYAGLSVRCVRY